MDGARTFLLAPPHSGQRLSHPLLYEETVYFEDGLSVW
jgi:hypothetical protein